MSAPTPRTLFSGSPIQASVYASFLAVIAHLGQRLLPQTLYAAIMAEGAVAFIALAAAALFVIAHHKKGHHRVMNQTQEEVVLIGLFGLFWFAFLVGLRVWQNQNHYLQGVPNVTPTVPVTPGADGVPTITPTVVFSNPPHLTITATTTVLKTPDFTRITKPTIHPAQYRASRRVCSNGYCVTELF